MATLDLSTYSSWPFTGPLSKGRTTQHTVYEKGAGPIIVLIQELPGIGQETLRLAETFVSEGFKVVLPHLFGPIGKTSRLNMGRVLCMSREFHLFQSNQSSPIVNWLKALCKEVATQSQVEGVGVIGMCLTGNFAISLMADNAVLAGVASQPSLPGFSAAGLHMGEEEISRAKERLQKHGPMLAYRFEQDKLCKAAKFDHLDTIFNTGTKPCINLKTLPGKGHAVLTLDFVNEAGHPTYQALEEVLTYFKTKLSA